MQHKLESYLVIPVECSPLFYVNLIRLLAFCMPISLVKANWQLAQQMHWNFPEPQNQTWSLLTPESFTIYPKNWNFTKHQSLATLNRGHFQAVSYFDMNYNKSFPDKICKKKSNFSFEVMRTPAAPPTPVLRMADVQGMPKHILHRRTPSNWGLSFTDQTHGCRNWQSWQLKCF